MSLARRLTCLVSSNKFSFSQKETYSYDSDVIKRKAPKTNEISYEKLPDTKRNGQINFRNHGKSRAVSLTHSYLETEMLSSNLNETPSIRDKLQQSQGSNKKSPGKHLTPQKECRKSPAEYRQSPRECRKSQSNEPPQSSPFKTTSLKRSFDDLKVDKRQIIFNATNVRYLLHSVIIPIY